jgi:hypothetical protein
MTPTLRDGLLAITLVAFAAAVPVLAGEPGPAPTSKLAPMEASPGTTSCDEARANQDPKKTK